VLSPSHTNVAVFGASGYVGGRLIPALLERGVRVRALTRHTDSLSGFPWKDQVEIVEADALDPASLGPALAGVDAAFYLVHSMGSPDFASLDRQAAANVANAAGTAELERIVYLGGLGDGDLSEHLASRQEVGRVLAGGRTPVIELRAAVILGAGSLSFEMLRYLTEVLPVMTTPRWVRTLVQPIGIEDVLVYLCGALGIEVPDHHEVLEIGGPDIFTYAEMMQQYAKAAGLRRRVIIPLPMLTPRLSSLWVGLVTPISESTARDLIESLRNEVVVRDRPASKRIAHQPVPFAEAVRRALHQTRTGEVPTRWSERDWRPAEPLPTDPAYAGGTMLQDRRERDTSAPAGDVAWAFSRVGGANGYYGVSWAWSIRGLLDQVMGGAGLRRGRRHPEVLRLGETVDFWTVVALEEERRLLLKADMKLPGEAWLEWVVDPTAEGSHVVQTATFVPRGLWGRIYWSVLIPFHAVVFPRMIRGVVSAAEGRSAVPTG